MSELLVLVHTVTPLVEVFNRLVREKLPGTQVRHILDEPLLEAVRRRGGLNAGDAERLLEHVKAAEAIGAQAVLVTCSTISPLVDRVGEQVDLPVLKIDEPMLDRAVRSGRRIGVLATNPSTLEPTRGLLLARAAAAGKTLEVETRLVEGALEALMGGDGEKHDRLLSEVVEALAQEVDVIVLAQASMARVLEVLPEREGATPVLTSPHLALEALQPILKGQGAGRGGE